MAVYRNQNGVVIVIIQSLQIMMYCNGDYTESSNYDVMVL